ncbi:hypothetical protein DFS33DRAFT_188428 [Desarmillaria ectypa]|nr:hypothetical protein DFS33DRAFT_188428 [Desarmillaria ectypa]
MSTFFYIVETLSKTCPPSVTNSTNASIVSPDAVSQATAAMLYIYACSYSLGWGPLPWVYVSDIVPTRTRYYSLVLTSASRWLWSFVVSKTTPGMVTNLGWKFFITCAIVKFGAMGLFLMRVTSTACVSQPYYLLRSKNLISGTKGRSLEAMDVIFGAISKEERDRNIIKQEHGNVKCEVNLSV